MELLESTSNNSVLGSSRAYSYSELIGLYKILKTLKFRKICQGPNLETFFSIYIKYIVCMNISVIRSEKARTDLRIRNCAAMKRPYLRIIKQEINIPAGTRRRDYVSMASSRRQVPGGNTLSLNR